MSGFSLSGLAKSMTPEALRDNLLTSDYRGMEFKRYALERLIEIEVDRRLRQTGDTHEVSGNPAEVPAEHREEKACMAGV